MSDSSQHSQDDDDDREIIYVDGIEETDGLLIIPPASADTAIHGIGGFGTAGVDASVGVTIPGTGSSPVGEAVDAFGEAGLTKGPTIYWTEKERREAAIETRFQETGGDAMWGQTVRRKEGAYRFFSRAAIVYNRRKEKVYVVRNAIYDKWQELGGLDWGTPNRDEEFVGDGRGRFCDFDQGDERKSIYWILSIGAHEVHGAIREQWRELGGPHSWFGYPVSDEEDFPDDGKASQFENGSLYWWWDIGAIPLGDISVKYTGFHCFGETDWDGGSSSDEPYFVMTVASAFGTGGYSTRVYSDVDSGEQRVDPFEIYRGKPFGINCGIVTMEYDHGNPDQVRNAVTNIANQVYNLAAAGAASSPHTAPATTALLDLWLRRFLPALGALVDEIAGWGDDVLGSSTVTISAREMVLLASRTTPGAFGAIPYKLESGLMSGEGASYKVYFTVEEI